MKAQSGKTDNYGFTIIELLIAIAIFGTVAAAMIGIYIAQSRVDLIQSQLVDMQQNLRWGLSFMAREMRPAGYKLPGSLVDAGLVIASPVQIQFTMDIGEPFGVIAGADESTKFAFATGHGADGDGIANAGRSSLGRDIGAGLQPFIEGIEAVGFAYAFDTDADGVLESSATGNPLWAVDLDGDGVLETQLDTNGDGLIDLNDNPAGIAPPGTLPALADIRAVQIWLLARSEFADRGYVEPAGTQYVVANRRIPGNDGFRRRLATTIVKLRNMP